MKAGILIILCSLFFLLFTPQKISAAENTSDFSATFAAILEAQRQDTRAVALQKYLEQFDSPLAPYSQTFVVQADVNNIPWDLVAAIAGTESTFGKVQPCNNSYGFGIYGNNMLCFNSVEDGIKTLSQTLREKYIDNWGCKNVDDIGHYYASSPTWSEHTKFFMNQIEEFKKLYDAQLLSISL